MKTKKIFFVIIMLVSMVFVLSCKKKDKDVKDTIAPVITIEPPNPYSVNKGTTYTYTDPGYTAYDETDGDITSHVVVTNNIDMADTGTYQVKYNVSDKAGNAATEAVRTVKVIIF
jgi:major membrane immunogen (membrane-anchored lipoprotein)